VRWLGRVRYQDAHAVQHALFRRSPDDHLLLLEHPHVYTLGVRADPANLLLDAEALRGLGADVVETDRGGDVTYHGPGQLVGYPILTVPGKRGGGMADTVAYVTSVEQLLIDVLADLGLVGCGRLRGYPGVWVDPEGPRPRKVAAIGVKLSRGRSMHGFALNVDPDLVWFQRMVPCGITDKGVTSLAAEGLDVSMHQVVDAVVARASAVWGEGLGHPLQRTDVVWRHAAGDADLSPFSRGEGPGEAMRPERAARPEREGTSVRLGSRLDEAGVTEGLEISSRKPEWMRVPVQTSPDYLRLKREIAAAGLVTVCEEAGCPNIWECWGEGTATFMINGERCTRACGFCLVDTRHPEPPDPAEPEKVADAVERMGLSYVVLTTVARDDLADGGASGFVQTVEAIRQRTADTKVELLISDCKGDPASLGAIFAARPDVLNHNVETVARLQRAVRPSAGYARSLAVLSRAKEAGLVTKSGLIVGMGETFDEVLATLADLRSVGVDIVTVGQYLRPTSHHLPIARWWTPDELSALADAGRALGLAHVEATPLTRSSHHAEHSYEVALRGRSEALRGRSEALRGRSEAAPVSLTARR
jgi:lipoic acid synthetase